MLFSLDDIKLKNISHNNQYDEKEITGNQIAVIGIAAKLSYAEDKEEFWDNLRKGTDCIREIPESRKFDIESYLNFKGVDHRNIKYPKGAYFEEIDGFDYNFFHIPPKEAELMEPAHRIFLETTWSAIEDAGLGGGKIKGTNTGVYVGYNNDSVYKNIISDINPNLLSLAATGNIRPILASRISHLLDLKGPNILIDTACSSSLVAVHLACQALLAGECEIALAGGIRTSILPFDGNNVLDIGTASSTGTTRSFDHSSDGTGGGEGSGVVILKPLKNALKDKDPIYALVLASAINNDGESVGLTAPNKKAQEDVLIKAWKKAQIVPETISYIESHGTGTKLGDPIEISALDSAFKRYTRKRQFCAVGALKTNIGHLDNAAGIMGFIKAVLALKNKEIPSNLHFERPNKIIKFIDSPVYISNTLSTWESESSRRRCGVSAFGFSGTNCHIVLEEAPDEKMVESCTKNQYRILELSAHSEYSLKSIVKKYKDYLLHNPLVDLDNLCYTANTCREDGKYRIALMFFSMDELSKQVTKLCQNGFLQMEEKGIYTNIGWTERLDYNKQDVKEYINIDKLDEQKQKAYFKKVCSSYVRGTKLNWNNFYNSREVRKLNIPVYQFDHKKCWIDIPITKKNPYKATNSNMFYQMVWNKEEQSQNRDIFSGKMMILRNPSNKIDRIVEKINGISRDTIEFMTEAAGKNDYNSIFSKAGETDIRRLIYFTCLSEKSADVSSYDTSAIVEFLRFLKSAIRFWKERELEIIVISEYAAEVSGKEEMIYPQNAMLFGLGKVVKWENPNINLHYIDIDNDMNAGVIAAELTGKMEPYKTAYRNNERYIELLSPYKKKLDVNSSIKIKSDGAYVITGGIGRIGLDIARFLAKENKAKIILVNRSAFPKRNEWDWILKEKNDTKAIYVINKLISIEETGASIECYQCNVCDRKAMETMMQEIRKKYGCINGVIHGAGVGVGLAGNSLVNENEDIFSQVLAPKVLGTWNLHLVTKEDNLDFFVMFSSITTLIGGNGSGSYISANTYLDAFAAYRKLLGKTALSINWPVWEDDKLSGINNHHEQEKQMFHIMTPDNAIHLFKQVLNVNGSSLLLGELNTESEILKLESSLPFTLSKEVKDLIGARKITLNAPTDSNIRLSGKQSNKYTETEFIIAGIWKQILGFEEINVDDNFYEIGGDSIKIIKMLELLKQNFSDNIVAADIFAYPTVAKLAAHINGTTETKEARNSITVREELFQIIYSLESGAISVEEAVNKYRDIEVE